MSGIFRTVVKVRLAVVGVGGGGGNAVDRMSQGGLQDLKIYYVNTDVQALKLGACRNKFQIGEVVTRGYGAGGMPGVGETAAQESLDGLRRIVEESDLIFLSAGMGGGTGSGTCSVLAELSRIHGVMSVGVVTFPFSFEGFRRCYQASQAISGLLRNVDTLIVVPNDRLIQAVMHDTTVQDAFRIADDVLRQGVQGVAEMISIPGLVNVDFADLQNVMSNSGIALLGVGISCGHDRAEDAALAAATSPLIEVTLSRACGIVYNITGSEDLSLIEVSKVSEVVTSLATTDANIIFGAVIDHQCSREVQVTLIITSLVL